MRPWHKQKKIFAQLILIELTNALKTLSKPRAKNLKHFEQAQSVPNEKIEDFEVTDPESQNGQDFQSSAYRIM